MSNSNNPDDPRPAWIWMGRFARVGPRWLVGFVARTVMRVTALRYRAAWARVAPQCLQFRLLIQGINAELYADRLRVALDVVAAQAPIYLRWLHRGIDWLVVNQLFMITRTVTAVEFSTRMLAIHPYTV